MPVISTLKSLMYFSHLRFLSTRNSVPLDPWLHSRCTYLQLRRSKRWYVHGRTGPCFFWLCAWPIILIHAASRLCQPGNFHTVGRRNHGYGDSQLWGAWNNLFFTLAGLDCELLTESLTIPAKLKSILFRIAFECQQTVLFISSKGCYLSLKQKLTSTVWTVSPKLSLEAYFNARWD